MSKTKTAPEPPAPIDNSGLAAAILQLASQFNASQHQIADTLDALQANQPKREPDYSEYLEKNPIPKLLKPAYQNAYPVNPHGLSDATISKLAQLKPGRYLNGVVTVTEGDDFDKTTYIHYKIKTLADRMNTRNYFSSFADLIDKLYAEMNAKAATE